MQAILMHIGVIAEMLKRERKDSSRDALLYEHLRGQFLALRSAPQPQLEIADEASERGDAQSESGKNPVAAGA